MEELILEGNSLLRFIGEHAKKGFAIVSACRGDMSRGANVQRTKELKELIKNAGFSFKQVQGGFIENKGKGNETEVKETSFIIYNFKNNGKPARKGELMRFALQACRRYNQDSILYSEKGDRPRYYTQKGEIDSSFSRKFVLNDKQQEYFTDMKSGSNERFTLNWTPESNDKKTKEMRKKAEKAVYGSVVTNDYFPY